MINNYESTPIGFSIFCYGDNISISKVTCDINIINEIAYTKGRNYECSNNRIYRFRKISENELSDQAREFRRGVFR
jgi:hypothetical protein